MSGDPQQTSADPDKPRTFEQSRGEEKSESEIQKGTSRGPSPDTADMCITTLQSTVTKPEILLEVLQDALGANTFKLDLRDDLFRISYPQRLDKEELVKRCRRNALQNKMTKAMQSQDAV